MKNNLTSLLACAAAVNLTSCGGISWTDYLRCVFAPGDYVPPVIEPDPLPLDDVDTAEEAEDLADTMDTLRTAIENAERLGIKVPSSAKAAYNLALEHLVKNNYFGSAQVREALSDESPL